MSNFGKYTKSFSPHAVSISSLATSPPSMLSLLCSSFFSLHSSKYIYYSRFLDSHIIFTLCEKSRFRSFSSLLYFSNQKSNHPENPEGSSPLCCLLCFLSLSLYYKKLKLFGWEKWNEKRRKLWCLENDVFSKQSKFSRARFFDQSRLDFSFSWKELLLFPLDFLVIFLSILDELFRLVSAKVSSRTEMQQRCLCQRATQDIPKSARTTTPNLTQEWLTQSSLSFPIQFHSHSHLLFSFYSLSSFPSVHTSSSFPLVMFGPAFLSLLASITLMLSTRVEAARVSTRAPGHSSNSTFVSTAKDGMAAGLRASWEQGVASTALIEHDGSNFSPFSKVGLDSHDQK